MKGIGKVSAKPDYVELYMILESKDRDYDKAMSNAGDQIQELNQTLGSIGFEKDSVKTTNFNVRTEYDRVKDRNDNYRSVFSGYRVVHNLKLSFDFDMKILSKALSAIAGCLAHPEFTISFTVKDATAINEEMLRSATINAKRKAEILCEASGVELGNLPSIDYSWGELDLYSHTRYECCEDSMRFKAAPASIDIDSEDVDVSDTATFIWEIK